MPVLVKTEVFMLVVDLINLIFTSFHILPHDYMLVVSLWSLCVDSLLFCKSYHVG
jgi:hypothetical protein